MSKKEYKAAEKGYEYSLSLIQYHTQLLWQEYGAFLLAETVIVGFLGSILSNSSRYSDNHKLVIAGAVLGLLICLPWYSTFLHNYQYYILRMAQARQYEIILELNLLSQGKRLSEGCVVEVGKDRFQHSMLANILPPIKAFRFLIGLFFIIFVGLIIFTITKI